MRSVSRLLGLSLLTLTLTQVAHFAPAYSYGSFPVEEGSGGFDKESYEYLQNAGYQVDPDRVDDDGLSRPNEYPDEGAPRDNELN